MLRVGLTGGIGAGKSAVATRLAELGAVIVDSDVLAREVVAPGTPGLAAVAEAFGADVLNAAGALDRAQLGELVFADRGARRRLEGIIHPLVRQRTVELTAAAAPDAVVVNDVPLLVEVGLAPTYHLVVVVEADLEVRVERLVGRGMTEDAARARIAAQASDDQRRAAADALLDNSGSRDELRAAVDALWAERLVPFERNVRAGRAVLPPEPLGRLEAGAKADPEAGAEADPGAGPDWLARYRRIEARLRHAVGDRVLEIDPIGATVVPGPPARDVIDVRLVVPARVVTDELAGDLAAAGYPAAGNSAAGEALRGGADPVDLVRVYVRGQ